MASSAPGVYVNVTASASNSQGANQTGQWFVVGNAAGPAGVVVPCNSISDFTNYFGQAVGGVLTGRYTVTPGSVTLDSTLLYDALDIFFKEGGLVANVSVLGAATGTTKASVTLGTNTFTAISGGTWANSSNASPAGLSINFTNSTVNSATTYSASVVLNGVVLASSPKFASAGAELALNQWINSLPTVKSLCTVATIAGSSALPTSNSTSTIYFTGGVDAATADTDVSNALAAFDSSYGPGQVSYPGASTQVVYSALVNHASANNRMAVLDVNPSHAATALVTDVAILQSAGVDTSYASIFGPWVSYPGATSGYARTVAPSAFAAAKMAANDQQNDANVPAAGTTMGASRIATSVARIFSPSDRALLNNAGVNVIRTVLNTGIIAIYGYRSLDISGNWTYLNNARFRMQIIQDFDVAGEAYMFQEIDGKGHIFSGFAGALSGICQNYWTRGSLYGASADQSFSVNTGPQVNTPATIAAGQINASVNLKMSPFGEFVTVNVTKYLSNANLPA